MTAQQTKRLRANLRDKFDAKSHERLVIKKYFIPSRYKTRNLQTIFKDIDDPDDFLFHMTNLVKEAKKLGATILLRKRGSLGGWQTDIADNGMCFVKTRMENDEEFESRMDIERESFVQREERKIREKQRDFDRGNALSKLTLKERKLLGVR